MKKIFLFLAAALFCANINADNIYCPAESIPYVQSFANHPVSSEYNPVEPECWTVSSKNPYVWVVTTKENGELVRGSEHLYATGGGTGNNIQVFAMPTFDAALNTLEVAFDYWQSYSGSSYASLEIGTMTDPSDASTFTSLVTLPQKTKSTHYVYSLANVSADAKNVAFRLAGGTSSFSNVNMDNFVVALIGKSGEIDPTQGDVEPDAQAYLLGKTYCEAQFAWYAYMVEAFAIVLHNADSKQLIAAIPATTGECDRFAYQDGIGFSEFDDYENKYYCSTKWILNADENSMKRGDAWSTSVKNIGTAVSPVIGLKPGKYQVTIYKMNATSYEMENEIGVIPFELESKEVSNLKAAVAEDKKTATLTWDTPELATGERLYVSVRSGETVAYDNFETMEAVSSPLVVNVEEGKSYTAYVSILDRKKNPLGEEVQTGFTVGVNPFEPKNPHAEVFGGDNVTFSWEVTELADRYVISLYLDGDYYTDLTVTGTTKTTTMPKDGTWTWTVQAFNEGSNDKYFEASNAIEGNSFVSKATDIPEDAEVLNVWGFEAAYLDTYVDQFPEGKYGWYITFATGDENGSGYPLVSFLLYTTKESAISGVYNVARANIDLESCYLNVDGQQANAILGTDAEVRLQFDGYDEEKAESGYRYGYYTGSFRIVGKNGTTYVAKFMELFCNSFNYSTVNAVYRDHKGMWDEDPDYVLPFGIEEIRLDETTNGQKFLIDGQLIIVRDGKAFNALGTRVK